jgi:aromatic-L-amino-acid decarboxylase
MYPLEPNSDEARRLIDEAVRRVLAHIESLPTQPAQNTEGAVEYARTLIEPLPESGTAYEALLDHLFDDLVPRSFTASGPGYLAYIPGGGIIHAAIADFIADAVNRYVGVFAAAPALAQIEANVVRWLCQIVGYGKGSGGLLTTGGSLANLIAVVAARKALLPDDFLRGTLYCGDQIHRAFQKAAMVAGFPLANVRELPSDDRFRVRVDALEDAIARDRAEGFMPFLIAGSAGTTNTGAVDDLEALARVARANAMWLHVDGAYGALFALTERGRATLRGIEQADSVVLDPHKTLFLPFGTGALAVRDAGTLRRAHSMHADYLPAFQQDEELVDFTEISPELSRDFRGLRVWLPVKLFGIGVFRAQLDEKLDLARWAADELRKLDGIEIVAEPQLSTVAFRLAGAGDAANRAFLARINAKKRVMLTGAVVEGRFVLRICVVSFRTHMERMRMCLEDIREAVASVVGC